MPKDTFDTPSEVSTPGNSALTRRMPSMRLGGASSRSSSWPVVTGNVSTSKIRSSGGSPYSPHAMSWMRRAISTLRSAVCAMPCLVDRQRHHRRAVLVRQAEHQVRLRRGRPRG